MMTHTTGTQSDIMNGIAVLRCLATLVTFDAARAAVSGMTSQSPVPHVATGLPASDGGRIARYGYARGMVAGHLTALTSSPPVN